MKWNVNSTEPLSEGMVEEISGSVIDAPYIEDINELQELYVQNVTLLADEVLRLRVQVQQLGGNPDTANPILEYKRRG